MDNDAKVRENRVRRAVERRGLRLVKSRRRDPKAPDFGKYRIGEDDGEEMSTIAWNLTLDEVEEWLSR